MSWDENEAAWEALFVELEGASEGELLRMARKLGVPWLPVPQLRDSSLYWVDRSAAPLWDVRTRPDEGGWWIDAFGPHTGETVRARCVEFPAAVEIIDTLVRMWSAEANAQR